MNKSAISRVKQIAWNTVDHWLERAAASCRRFNNERIAKIHIRDLQTDEIRTMVAGHGHPPVWIFAAIEVWSRLWPATVVGKRSYRNTLSLFRELADLTTGANLPLIATDGFKFYRQVVRRLFGVACLYGQVIKKRKNDRVVRVQRRTRIGTAWHWNEAWRTSEDSRQRRTERLEDHLELLRCHYNFLRPHRALRFGREVRTPAMQAGLTQRRLSFRDIFKSIPNFLRMARTVRVLIFHQNSTGQVGSAISLAAQQHWIAEAPSISTAYPIRFRYLTRETRRSHHTLSEFSPPRQSITSALP